MKPPTVGSAFSGIGGLDLGFEQAGWSVSFQVECDLHCRRVLSRHWPDVPLYEDVRTLDARGLPAVDALCGGDPCPIRSRARGTRSCRHPDLAGYFLALVGRCRPRWVVRENVPAPDVRDFAAGLAALGYGVLVVELDSRDFTGQSRRREYCLGCPPTSAARLARALSDAADGRQLAPSRPEETTPLAACLTAHPARMAAEDSYCFEPGRGLRILDRREREALQGFPRGWTGDLVDRHAARCLGNAVTVPVARWIAERVREADE
jgi:DNA (cytosine-5)-methyltransferase 1